MGAWDITWKDLKLLARDTRALVLLLLLPLLFIAILGMSTGQFLTTKEPPRKFRIAIANEDQGTASKKAIRKLESHESLEIITEPSRTAARESLKKENVSAALVFGPNYQERVDELTLRDMFSADSGAISEGPEAIDLSLELRPAFAEADLIRYFLFGEIYRSIFPDVARRNAIMRPYLPPEEEEAAPEEPATPEVATTETDAPAWPAHEGMDGSAEVATTEKVAEKQPAKQNPVYRFLVPGFTVMFVFFLINIMARSFIAERDIGTLRRLRLAPISPVAVLIGKTLPFYVASVVQTGLLFLSGRLLFDMPWGPEPIYLIPVILATSAAATSLGLLLAASVRTDQQVSAYGTSLVLVLGGISGCFIPRPWMPELMKTLSLATPHAWALRAFEAVLARDEVDSILILDNCFVLMGFASVFFIAGWWRFKSQN